MRDAQMPVTAAPPLRAQPRRFATAIVIATVFLLLYHHRGEVIQIGDFAASNIPVFLSVTIFIASSRFLRKFPREFLIPSITIIAMLASGFYHENLDRIFLSIQALIFLLYPCSLGSPGRKALIMCMFLFAITSQIYLLIMHGGLLLRFELGGFFLTRRTVHSLFLGFIALATLQYVRSAKNRASIIILVFFLMILSQARGAAIAFLLAVLFFGQDFHGRWTRFGVAVLATFAIAASVLLEPEILEHFQALFRLSGGSSTSYRLYLFQLLTANFPDYWLFGMRWEDIQFALANQFTRGLLYQEFPLDNSFVHTALVYGGVALLGLVMTAAKLTSMRQSFAFFLVLWFLLDDITGSALGWLLIGLCLSQNHARNRIMSPRMIDSGGQKLARFPPPPDHLSITPAQEAETERR